MSKINKNIYQYEFSETLSGGWGKVQNYVMRIPELSMEAKGLYSLLCCYKGSNNVAFPSIKQLSTDLGVSRKTVIKYLQELSEFGLIKKSKLFKNSALRNLKYQILYIANIINEPTEQSNHLVILPQKQREQMGTIQSEPTVTLHIRESNQEVTSNKNNSWKKNNSIKNNPINFHSNEAKSFNLNENEIELFHALYVEIVKVKFIKKESKNFTHLLKGTELANEYQEEMNIQDKKEAFREFIKLSFEYCQENSLELYPARFSYIFETIKEKASGMQREYSSEDEKKYFEILRGGK